MKSCKGGPSDLTAEKARYSTATYTNQPLQLPTKPSRRRRIDRLAGIWDDEVVPMLVAAPGLRPIVVFREISHRHPEFAPSARRTLERRIRYWQSVNDPEPDVTFRRGRIARSADFDASFGIQFFAFSASRQAALVRPASASQNP